MITPITNVRPGDIISSDLMNFVLSKLQEFDGRISKLESGTSAGQVQVTGFIPPLQQNAGQNLTIQGVNFATPADVNIVKLNDTQITSFTSPNTNAVLNFIIPNSFVPPPDGNVTVSVSNSMGRTSALYKVLPFVPVTTPPPVVLHVLSLTAGVPLVNSPIKITGSNFAPTSAGDNVSFQVTASDGSSVSYPKAGTSLTFDPPGSGTSDSSNIFVTLPDIAEVSGHGPASDTIVTLVLTVGSSTTRFTFHVQRP